MYHNYGALVHALSTILITLTDTLFHHLFCWHMLLTDTKHRRASLDSTAGLLVWWTMMLYVGCSLYVVDVS